MHAGSAGRRLQHPRLRAQHLCRDPRVNELLSGSLGRRLGSGLPSTMMKSSGAMNSSGSSAGVVMDVVGDVGARGRGRRRRRRGRLAPAIGRHDVDRRAGGGLRRIRRHGRGGTGRRIRGRGVGRPLAYRLELVAVLCRRSRPEASARWSVGRRVGCRSSEASAAAHSCPPLTDRPRSASRIPGSRGRRPPPGRSGRRAAWPPRQVVGSDLSSA